MIINKLKGVFRCQKIVRNGKPQKLTDNDFDKTDNVDNQEFTFSVVNPKFLTFLLLTSVYYCNSKSYKNLSNCQ